jgi:uncharacterized metal-binding protein|tara:strand:+ start:75 stop:377 length:303 start_codon:yes stop_codon:yes gene_type:complete
MTTHTMVALSSLFLLLPITMMGIFGIVKYYDMKEELNAIKQSLRELAEASILAAQNDININAKIHSVIKWLGSDYKTIMSETISVQDVIDAHEVKDEFRN